MIKSKLLILFSITFLIALQASVIRINAQTQYPEGITVIPSIVNLDLANDAPEYDLRYINNTGSDISLELSSQDFSELDEEYRVNFLEPKDAANYEYSLSSWITFENKNLEIPAREEKSIKVFIDDDRITKGGHHAIILARAVQENIEEQININPVISSLLFVRASTGREIENADVSTFRPDRNLLNFPDNFILRFENQGNVHVIPFGEIIITDMLGNRVARGVLNERGLNALPESIRRYEIEVDNETKFLIPGVYTAKIDMHYGNSKKELSRTAIFFSQGSIDFIKIGTIIIIILVILFIFRNKIKNIIKRNKSETTKESKIKNKKEK